MAKDREKKKAPIVVPVRLKKAMPLLILAVGIAFVCLIGGLVAKYTTTFNKGDNQIGAENFYFTLDLFAATDKLAGQDENTITQRTVDLYGLGQTSLAFSVENFMDALRISPDDINYTISWVVSGDITASVTKDAANVDNGSTAVLAGGSSTAHSYTVTNTSIDSTASGSVTVTVTSTAPYHKVLTLTINFHPDQYDVLYRVEDTAGEPAATLIVMAGKPGGIPATDLIIDWSTVNASGNMLQIDTTNSYILSGDGGSGSLSVGVSGDYLSSVKTTKAIPESGSISILFFKTDPSKDYSQANTAVSADANGDYTVTITENAK